MAVKEIKGPPGTLPLYARAAAPLIPLASRLPFVAGRGKEMPDLELVQREVAVDPGHLAEYARVCAFTLRDTLPPTYPHVLAFPLHMALMTDGSFPFGAVGLVHLENAITQLRPIGVGERLELRVRPTAIEPHAKGRTFSLVTEVRAGGDLAWQSTSTMLRRGGVAEGSAPSPTGGEPGHDVPRSAEWRLPGDLGRRYAGVSGDRNPIHLHPLSARLFGFPRAIAHGMWTKARCLAALEPRLEDSFTAHVAFRRPLLLPATVGFGSTQAGATTRFAVRGARDGERHLDGQITSPITTKGSA
jgi:acyl dehydratase